MEMLHDDVSNGKGLSSKVFVEEYCAPVRHAEQWVKAKKKEFGKLAEMPTFNRVKNFLFSSRARVAVLACMRSGVRLEGISADQPGIEQCRMLIEDLQRLKTKPAGAAPSDNQQEAGAIQDAGSDAAGAVQAASSEAGTVEAGTVGVDLLEHDPTREAAKSKTEAAMSKFAYYTKWEQFDDALPSLIMPQQKLLIMVDAPTSKVRVLSEANPKSPKPKGRMHPRFLRGFATVKGLLKHIQFKNLSERMTMFPALIH